MKKTFPLRTLVALSLVFAFALPVSAESVTKDVYGQEVPPVVVGVLNVHVVPGDSQLSVSVSKASSEKVSPDTFTFTLQKKGETAPIASAEVMPDSFQASTINYTFKNLTDKVEYAIMVTGSKDGKVVGNGNASGTPASATPVMKGLKATAGDAQVTIAFDKLTTKPLPANYQIQWSYKDKDGKQMNGKTVVIKAADAKKSTFSYSFKKLNNGTMYSFTVFAEDSNKQKLALTSNLTATPKAKNKK
ncbi:MAG: hypothetical protein JWR03_957 [Cohnella sp.]|nr:hypothetical protein [Cohnella sp.]